MTQQLIIKVTRILNPVPQNHVPPNFSVAVSPNPATKCRVLTVSIDTSISGIVNPQSTISTVLVPQPLWDDILNHAVPFQMSIDHTLLSDGTLRVDNLGIQNLAPSPLLSPQPSIQDAAETTSTP